MKTTRSWVPLLLSVITLAVHGAPEATGQGFSNWSTPVNLGPTINSSAFEGCHFVTEAGLSLYFASDRPGGLGDRDIYVSRRAGINDPWGPPQNLGATINTVSDDRCPFVTPDGHTMIFASARSGGQGMGDLYVSFRRNPLDNLAWETPQNLTELNTASDEFGPSAFVHPQTGGLVLFFNSTRPGGLGGQDIYSSTLRADGRFSSPTVVSELSSTANEIFPVVRQNGLELILNSNRPGGFGGSDLWVATRATISEPWSVPVNLGAPINTPAGASRGGTYAGGTRLVFHSTRTGSAGTDIWEATRTRTSAIPVSVSATGQFGTTYKTAGQLSNPYATMISGTLVFHPAGLQQSASDLVIPYTLNPFETRTSSDLMASFGATGVGWLEIVPATEAAPASFLRIEDGVGGAAAVSPVSEANILVAGSRGVLVTPSDLGRLRLNIGIRTLSNGVTMTVGIYDAAAVFVRTVTRSFGPTYFAQFAATDLLGGAIAANQTVVFSIDSGSAVVYGFSAANGGPGLTLQVAQRLGP